MKLYLIRGLPGAGKTTEAYRLTSWVYEADDYFYISGQYQYVAAEIGLAHKFCQLRTEVAMLQKRPIIAVSNTFVRRWELEVYYKLAATYFYVVEEKVVDYGMSIKELAESNLHGVPVEKIAYMKEIFEA